LLFERSGWRRRRESGAEKLVGDAGDDGGNTESVSVGITADRGQRKDEDDGNE